MREKEEERKSEETEKMLEKQAGAVKMRKFRDVWKEIKPSLERKRRRGVAGRIAAAVSLSVAGVFVSGLVLRFLIQAGVFEKELFYDYGQAEYARQRVAEAQYLPDPEKLASSVKNAVRAASVTSGGENTEEELARIGLDGFRRCVDSWGTIEGMGAGKYLGYSIYEIRDELYEVLGAVPAFGRWFRFPDDAVNDEGEKAYYEDWAYCMEYDEERDALTMTRVCWATRCSYYDFENKKIVEEYDEEGNESIVQFEVMRTNYYYDEAGRETVEAFVYAVACDHVDTSSKKSGRTGYYQPEEKYYYPLSVQYLKNVRDTSLTKYIVEYSERESTDRLMSAGGWDFSGHTFSYDIANCNSDGTRLEFLQLDYGGSDDVRMLKIRRRLPSRFIGYDAADICFYVAAEESAGYAEGYYDRCSDLSAPTARNALGGDIDLGRIDEEFGFISYGLDIYEGVSSGEDITRWQEETYGDQGGIWLLLNRSVAGLGEKTGLPEGSADDFLRRADDALLSGEKLAYAEVLDGYTASVAANIASSFCLRSEWPEIYEKSDRAVEADADGIFSAAGEKTEIEDASSEIVVSDGEVRYALSGRIPASILLQAGADYSLRPVFLSENGERYLPEGTAPSVRAREGEDLRIEGEGKFLLSEIDIPRSGIYTLGMALVKGNRTICSSFVPVRVKEFEPALIPSVRENGFEKEYKVTCTDGTLQIKVGVTDVQPPVVTGENRVTLPLGTSVAGAFSGVRIRDNGTIVSAEIFRPDGRRYARWDEAAEEGVNVLVVRDEGGNETRFSLLVYIG